MCLKKKIMETEVSLELLETLIEGGNKHVAESWLDILEDQLSKFVAAEQEEEPFKNFAGLGHLVWWTLSSVKKFNDDPQFLAANVFVPWHSALDDFLCLADDRRSHDSLIELLKIIEGEFYNHGDFEDEENPEFRDEVIDFLQSEGATENAADLEMGCYLYASMVALVNHSTTEAAMPKWKEVYHMKVLEMTEALKQNCEPSVLLPFTERRMLFAETRKDWDDAVLGRMEADKKLYDIENDRSNTESDFQCPKCGSFKTVYYPLQMRSADEPMAVLWECYECNKSGVQK